MYTKEFFLWYTCCHQIWSQFSFTRMVHCTWMFIIISCFYGKEEIFSWWFFSQLLFPFLLTICSHWIFTWFFFFLMFSYFSLCLHYSSFLFFLFLFFFIFFYTCGTMKCSLSNIWNENFTAILYVYCGLDKWIVFYFPAWKMCARCM